MNEIEQLVLTLSPKVSAFLDEVAAEDGIDRADVIRRAFGLLRLARSARRRGLTVGAVADDGHLEVEWTGF